MQQTAHVLRAVSKPMSASIRYFENVDTDELLPPSAFLTSHRPPGTIPVPTQLTEIGGCTRSPVLDGVRSVAPPESTHVRGAALPVRSDSRDQLASSSSKLAIYEARVQELAQELHAIRRENLLLQHSRDAARTELRQLRAYISSAKWTTSAALESEQMSSKPATAENSNHVELEKQVAELTEQNTQLKRELDLSAVRVRNIETVLRLQEKNLCASKPHDGGKVLVDSENIAKSERLLTGWRSQVLRLLVQAEQHKADLAHAVGEARRKTADVEQCRQAAALEQEASRLKTEASEAALTAEKERNEILSKQLERELAKLHRIQNEFLVLQKTASVSFARIHADATQLALCFRGVLHPDSASNIGSIDKPSIASVFHRVRQLERRLSFAVDRLPVLRARLCSRRVVPLEQTDQSVQTHSLLHEPSAGPLSYSELEELLSHANLESQRLRVERDSALAELERNSKTFQQRVQSAQDEVKMEVIHLRDMTETLRENLKLKDQELVECHVQIAQLKSAQLDQQQQATEEHTRLQTQCTQAQEQLAQARSELRNAERMLNDLLDQRRDELNKLERNCEQKTERLGHVIQTMQPLTSDIFSTDFLNADCGQSVHTLNYPPNAPNQTKLGR
ncbi:unnamed protein product [Dicrocoelium dendriticum]|nr:unnamed protein product [Dicrocoelium dendriticum]